MTAAVAIVTGGARGIGAAVSRALAEDGMRVALADLDGNAARGQARRLEAAGGIATGIGCDVRSRASVRAMVARVAEQWSRIDVLVNNAGITGAVAPIQDYPFEEWRKVLAVDLDGAFLCTAAVVPHMLARSYGRIVNVASIAGKDPNAEMPAYAAAKAGLIGLTKSVAKELARSGILVNAITPGGVGGTGIAGLRRLDGAADHAAAATIAKTPLGRLGTPEEIAELVRWLASERCSYATGAVFDISGGRASY